MSHSLSGSIVSPDGGVNRDNAITKAVTVLQALRGLDLGGSARELALSTGLPRSTVQRLLTTLQSTGMVMQDQNSQRYRIGPEALVIGLGYKQGLDLARLARPIMTTIRDQTMETVGLSVAVGDARVFIEEVQTTAELRFASELGRLYPLWSGASGRVLLSGLSDSQVRTVLADHRLDDSVHRVRSADEILTEVARIRMHRYAIAANESVARVSSVAVPVHDASEAVVAALSVSGPMGRLTRKRMTQVLPGLREGAARLSAQLGAPAGGLSD